MGVVFVFLMFIQAEGGDKKAPPSAWRR